MPKVKPNVAEKWGRVTPQRIDDYLQGVQNPREDWQRATLAAAANQASAIQQAIKEKRFEKGVSKAGTQKWQAKTLKKGAERFGPGVQEGQDAYEVGIAPYLQTIEATTLPPRYPKGDPRNIERVKVMSDALRKKKLSM